MNSNLFQRFQPTRGLNIFGNYLKWMDTIETRDWSLLGLGWNIGPGSTDGVFRKPMTQDGSEQNPKVELGHWEESSVLTQPIWPQDTRSGFWGVEASSGSNPWQKIQDDLLMLPMVLIWRRMFSQLWCFSQLWNSRDFKAQFICWAQFDGWFEKMQRNKNR